MIKKFKRLALLAVRGCNLRCEHCFSKGNNKVVGTKAPPEIPLKNLERLISENGILEVSMCGHGEPTLLPNFEDFFAMINNHPMLRQITIFSNVCAKPIDWWKDKIISVNEGKWFEIVASLHPDQGNTKHVMELCSLIEELKPSNVGFHINCVVSEFSKNAVTGVLKTYPEFLEKVRFTWDDSLCLDTRKEIFSNLRGDLNESKVTAFPHNGWSCGYDWGSLFVDLEWFNIFSVYSISWDGNSKVFVTKPLDRFRDEDFIIPPPPGEPPKGFISLERFEKHNGAR